MEASLPELVQGVDWRSDRLGAGAGYDILSYERYIRRGTHRSTRQLEAAIKHYVKVNNADPKPFIWAKTADDILASVERFCLRISNSRH